MITFFSSRGSSFLMIVVLLPSPSKSLRITVVSSALTAAAIGTLMTTAVAAAARMNFLIRCLLWLITSTQCIRVRWSSGNFFVAVAASNEEGIIALLGDRKDGVQKITKMR